MKNYFIVLLIMTISCGKTTELDELAKQTEKIQIVFNDDPKKFTDITEKKEIRKFSNYISEEETPLYKCGYDGYVIYFTKGGSVRMDFNLTDDCQHVVYEYAAALQTKKLTDEGVEYLKALKK